MGITRQDGSYLAELIFSKIYKFEGIMLRASVFTNNRIEHLFDYHNYKFHHYNLIDYSIINRMIGSIQPGKAFNWYACNRILFNYESPRHGKIFVAKKIIKAVASIKLKKIEMFYLKLTQVILSQLKSIC